MTKVKTWISSILQFIDRANNRLKAKIDEKVEARKRSFYLQHHIEMNGEEIQQYRTKLIFENVGAFCLILLLLFMIGGTLA